MFLPRNHLREGWGLEAVLGRTLEVMGWAVG